MYEYLYEVLVRVDTSVPVFFIYIVSTCFTFTLHATKTVQIMLMR